MNTGTEIMAKKVNVSQRTLAQLESLTPEQRARAEAFIAKTQTPEYREEEARVRDMESKGRKKRPPSEMTAAPDDPATRKFLMALRQERERRGLSLGDVAERSGIDKAALSRLENGQVPNPTVNTLARYVRALGKQLILGME
jgi:transcriptional regulator with XRE-family HTH domain